jgi:hypothetical protein
VSAPHPTIRLINAWYSSAWILILAAVIYHLTHVHSLISLSATAPLTTLVVFSILAVRTETRLFACLALTTLMVPFYLFEFYLIIKTDLETHRPSKVAHITRLREQGIAVYPAVVPSGFLSLWLRTGGNNPSPIMIEGREILPLAGIPTVLTSYCPLPDGSWVTYHSDRFGFRNPPGTERGAPPKFALLGDSFVHGFCVPDASTYAAQLSVLGPTASYGMNGTSILTQLAIYREYVKALRPEHIIWFFYEGNDVAEYLRERTWPLLRAYLDPAHVQDLVRLNGSLSVALKQFINQQLASNGVATVVHDREHRNFRGEIFDFLRLRRTRRVLTLAWEGTPPALTETDWREISGIWREVIEMQHAQGGRITFVYIPAHWRFLAKDPARFQALERKVVTLWSGLGADYVTLTKPLEATGNPLAYYAHNDLHFNEEGYRLTAAAIVKHLRHSAGG